MNKVVFVLALLVLLIAFTDARRARGQQAGQGKCGKKCRRQRMRQPQPVPEVNQPQPVPIIAEQPAEVAAVETESDRRRGGQGRCGKKCRRQRMNQPQPAPEVNQPAPEVAPVEAAPVETESDKRRRGGLKNRRFQIQPPAPVEAVETESDRRRGGQGRCGKKCRRQRMRQPQPAPEVNQPAPVEVAPVEAAPVEAAAVETESDRRRGGQGRCGKKCRRQRMNQPQPAPVEVAPVEAAPVEAAPVETESDKRRRGRKQKPQPVVEQVAAIDAESQSDAQFFKKLLKSAKGFLKGLGQQVLASAKEGAMGYISSAIA